MRLWLAVCVVAVAALTATGAFGISVGGTITTFAGTGAQGFSGDGGPATSAQLDAPYGVAMDGQGNVYIADTNNQRVRKVSAGGTITTIAGFGIQPGFSGDGGRATSAQLNYPRGVAVDGQGNVYIADFGSNRVRKVSPGGTIATFAGSGPTGAGSGFSGDGGPATSARLAAPTGVAVDGLGNVYIADRDNRRVRKVSTGGTITTLAGTGVLGDSGDGGPATSAQLHSPTGVAVDGQGNVYIVDDASNRVRKVDSRGTITTFAGTGVGGSSGDGGPATSARLRPVAVAVDGQGNVYIVDYTRVRVVNSVGTITAVAGGGRALGDGGPAISAQLSGPTGVAVDRHGNVYISDRGTNRVRKVTAGAQPAGLTLTLGGASTQRLLSQGITVTARCDKPCSLSATGSVTILGTRYAFGLTRATSPLAAGMRALTLRFPAAEQKRFRQLLKPGEQARAMLTVRATDKAGNTSTSKRMVAVLPSPKVEPLPNGTPPSAKLGSFVDRIESVLAQSAAGRRQLGAALGAGFNCSISPRAAGQRIARVVDNRQSILGQLGSLEGPNKQASEALRLLRLALRHSIDADIHYRDGFLSIVTSRCPLPSNANFELATRSDVLATTAKQRFAVVFNRLARSVNRRTWLATEI